MEEENNEVGKIGEGERDYRRRRGRRRRKRRRGIRRTTTTRGRDKITRKIGRGIRTSYKLLNKKRKRKK